MKNNVKRFLSCAVVFFGWCVAAESQSLTTQGMITQGLDAQYIASMVSPACHSVACSQAVANVNAAAAVVVGQSSPVPAKSYAYLQGTLQTLQFAYLADNPGSLSDVQSGYGVYNAMMAAKERPRDADNPNPLGYGSTLGACKAECDKRKNQASLVCQALGYSAGLAKGSLVGFGLFGAAVGCALGTLWGYNDCLSHCDVTFSAELEQYGGYGDSNPALLEVCGALESKCASDADDEEDVLAEEGNLARVYGGPFTLAQLNSVAVIAAPRMAGGSNLAQAVADAAAFLGAQ